MTLYKSIPHENILLFIIKTPDDLKANEMCNEAVCIEPYSLIYVPDNLKTKEMCDDVVRSNPFSVEFVPDHFKGKEKPCTEDHNHWRMSPIGL